jgi:Cu-processing system permease protein
VGKLVAIASAVVADAMRRKVVWVVAAFAAVLAVAIPALPSYGVGVVGAVFREVALALMYAAALVVALALSATRIPAEVERRTVFPVVARDVRRWQYVAATWIGMFAVLGIVLLAFVVATIVIGRFEYETWMWVLFEGGFAVWLEMGAIMALTVALSTRLGPVTSVVGALAFAFVGHSWVILLNLPEMTRPPWWMPGLDVFNVINPVAHGSGYSLAYAASMVVVAAAWAVVLLLLGSLMFGSRDL